MKNNPNIYIGLDQALTETGVAVADLDSLTIYTTTLKSPNSKNPMWERQDFILKSINQIISKFLPSKIFLEEVYQCGGKTISSSAKLHTILDMLSLTLYQKGVEFSVISPNPTYKDSWPKILGITTPKDGIKTFLDGLALDSQSEHELDAIGVLWGSLVKENLVTLSDISKFTISRADFKDFFDKLTKKTSFSRMDSFTKCPVSYKLKYVTKLDKPSTIEQHFILGKLTHSLIELYLNGAGTKGAIIVDCIIDWLEKDALLLPNDLEDFVTNLVDYGMRAGLLYYLASPACKDKRIAIRNADGSLGKVDCLDSIIDMPRYCPKSFKERYYDEDLHVLRQELDTTACEGNPTYYRFSLSNVVAKAVSYLIGFKPPSVFKTVGTEIDLKSNGKIPWDHETYWDGYIDWVVETVEGEHEGEPVREGLLGIIDTKTGRKEVYTRNKVQYHDQLNLYVALYYEMTGRKANFIGINHVPSGDLVLAKVDWSVVSSIYEHWKSVQRAIQLATSEDIFIPQRPTGYNSPCIQWDWKDKSKISSLCPYLENCHPNYFNAHLNEIDIFHGGHELA